jgi:hypothetical protein
MLLIKMAVLGHFYPPWFIPIKIPKKISLNFLNNPLAENLKKIAKKGMKIVHSLKASSRSQREV